MNKLNTIIIIFLLNFTLIAMDIVIYEKVPHSKSMEVKLSRGDRGSVIIKKYSKESLDELFSKNRYSKLLIISKIIKDDLVIESYKIQTKKSFLTFREKNRGNLFFKLVSKLILLYDLESKDNLTIFQAIKNNDLKLVKSLNLNKKNIMGMTPLNYALSLKKYDLIKYLLIDDKQIYESDNFGVTPLHRILEKGDLDLFKKYYTIILKDGRTKSNETFLHFAALSGNLDLVKYLLSIGFDMKAETLQNKNILDFAVISGNIKLVEFLLKKDKTLLTKKTKNGKNILHFAIQSKNIQFVKEIIKLLKKENFDIFKNQLDNYKNNYYFYAALTDDVKYSKEVEKLGFLPENIDKIIYFLIINNRVNMLQELISTHKIDIFKKGKYGIPALHIARYLYLNDFKRFINSSEKIKKIKDDNSLNALNYAVLGGNFGVLIYLQNIGMDINYVTKNGENLLYFSMIGGYKNIFFYLLNKGVSSDIKLKDNNSLLHIAAEDNWFYKILIKYNPKLEKERNKFGEYPVHFVVKFGNLELLRDIVSRDILSIYLYDNLGNDLIKTSIYTKQDKILDYLLSLRPRLNITNTHNETALDIAILTKNNHAILQLSKFKALRERDNQF